MDRRLFAAGLVAAVTPAWVRADDKLDALVKNLEKAKVDFAKGREAAKKVALVKFDTAERVIKAQPVKPTVKQGLLAELEADRQRFEKGGHWPAAQDLMDAGLVFGKAVSAAYDKVSVAFEKLVKHHQTAKDDSSASAVTAEKGKFEEAELPGRAGFKAGVLYKGTRRFEKRNSPFNLKLTALTGPVVTGLAEQLDDESPLFKLRGTIDGIKFGCSTVNVKTTSKWWLALDGLVLGDRLLLQVGKVDDDGNAASGGLATLRRT